MSDQEKAERGQRVRELRLRLGFPTQEALADAAGERLERTYVNRVENGGNALTSLPLQRAFAEALGLRVVDFADYLDGHISIEQVTTSRRGSFEKPPNEMPAADLVRAVEELPGLRQYIMAHPKSLTLTELTIGIEAYKKTRPSSRVGDRAPAAGWEAFFRDAIGNATEHTQGDVRDVNRLAAKQIGRRPRLRGK